MVASTVYLIAFLALIVWRFVFAALQRRQLVQEMVARQQREIKLLWRVGVAVIAEGCFENGLQGVDPFAGKDRATTYLRRIVALTGATQTGGTFVLDATALLDLTNNPTLFDRWAAQVGAVRADGQVFSGAQ